jgi:hypothetical protein
MWCKAAMMVLSRTWTTIPAWRSPGSTLEMGSKDGKNTVSSMDKLNLSGLLGFDDLVLVHLFTV